MKQFTAFIFALFFLSFLSGCRESSKKPPSTKATAAVPATETFRHDFSNDENFHESGGNLTMATLIDLVDRYGDNLTWDTFAPYWYEDFSSSDTYSFRYPVNINYDLKLRGASMEAPPEPLFLLISGPRASGILPPRSKPSMLPKLPKKMPKRLHRRTVIPAMILLMSPMISTGKDGMWDFGRPVPK